MDSDTMEHITPEEMEDYWAARLPEAREEAIEAHLAGCPACVEEARQHYAFAMTWEEWTGMSAGAAQDDVAEQSVLQTALAQAQRQEADPAWRARLAHWQTHWQGKAAAAVRLVMEAADQAVHVVTEGLEALTTPGDTWDVALASASGSARGAGADRDVSHVAATPGAISPQVIIRVGRVSPQATRLIQISVQALPAHQAPPLVLLIPATAGGVPQVAALELRQNSEWLIATFRNVPQGDYLLAFEPMEDASPA